MILNVLRQLVWKSTRMLGVGIATMQKGFWRKTYVVAQYTPQGNIMGQFEQQVGNNIFSRKREGKERKLTTSYHHYRLNSPSQDNRRGSNLNIKSCYRMGFDLC